MIDRRHRLLADDHDRFAVAELRKPAFGVLGRRLANEQDALLDGRLGGRLGLVFLFLHQRHAQVRFVQTVARKVLGRMDRVALATKIGQLIL